MYVRSCRGFCWRVAVPGAAPRAPRNQGGAPAVNAARLVAADSEQGNWMSYGRTYDEQRFSPLQQINAGNVGH